MTRSRAQAGFTLVELMVIIAIIGILAVIGVPSFVALMPRMRLNSNVMVLTNEIALARVRAISKSADFRIVFDTVNDRYTIYKYQTTWQSLGSTELAGSNLVRADGFGVAQTLIVSPSGQVNVPLNSQAEIEVRTPSGDRRKRLLVEPTGRVAVDRWDPNASAWVRE